MSFSGRGSASAAGLYGLHVKSFSPYDFCCYFGGRLPGWLAGRRVGGQRPILKGVQICHARNLGQVDEICSISVMAATMYGRIHNFNTADRHCWHAGQAE